MTITFVYCSFSYEQNEIQRKRERNKEGDEEVKKHVEAKRWKGAVWRTPQWKIKRQNCNRSNNGTSAHDYIRSLCVTRQTDLTTRFTKESYLFLLVYNRAPNDSKWNPFLSFWERNTDSASCRFKRRALHGETNSLKKKKKKRKKMAWGRYRNIFSAREVETKRKIRERDG